MPATKTITAAGTTISVAYPSGSNSFVTVNQINSITLTTGKINFQDITNLSSPTSGSLVVKEQLPVSIETGTLEANAYFDPVDAAYNVLLNAANGTLCDFKVQLQPATVFGQTTTGNSYSFSGYVSEVPLPTGFSQDKAMEYKFSVNLNTKLTVGAGS